jgi:hypothetical protein
VLAFLSVVDATIPPRTLIDTLFFRLAAEGHELVLFDVNRHSETGSLLRSNPDELVKQLLAATRLKYGLTLITNSSPDSDEMVARKREAGSAEDFETPVNFAWPEGVFSLSHIALPFPPDDPIYGSTPDEDETHPWITLGSVAIRGERGLLLFPDSYFMRLRYNPFYTYMTARIVGFLGTES